MADQPVAPSLPWRIGSSAVMGIIGMASRSFLCGLNRVEVNGLDKFQQLLEERKDVAGRTRGLITGLVPEFLGDTRTIAYQCSSCTAVSNHLSVYVGILELDYAESG